MQHIRVRTFPVFAAALISLAAGAKPQLRRPPPQGVTPARETATTTTLPNLVYCGGRVLSQATIVPVLWGPPEDPVPASATCTGHFKDCLDSWYADFAASPQFDWLDEYQTTITAQDGLPGTNQHIMRPIVVKAIQITPINTKAKVGELDVENELVSQIQAMALPAPDANSETIYEVHFPLTVDPSDPNQIACSAFCAYHDSWVSNKLGKTGIIAIIPSHMPPGYSGGRDCSLCGEKDDWFANLGGSISHESIEAITDPDVGQAGNGCDSPLGWYDMNDTDALSYHGEIGDICEGIPNVSTASQITEDTLTGSDSFQYTVQREWSNQFGACMVDKTEAFKISVPASPLTVDVGNSVTTPVVVSAPSNGSTTTLVTLVARGLPTGITATFAPAKVNAGQTSMMTVTITGTTTTGGVFGITGEAGATQAQATVALSAPEFSASLSTSSIALTAAGPAATVVLSTMLTTGSQRPFTVKAVAAPGVKLAETGGDLGTDLTLHFTAIAGAPSTHTAISLQVISGGVTKTFPIQLALTGDDASVSAPSVITINAGGSATFTVTTATTSGSPQALALVATGLPDGATSVFSPISITSGQTSTCKITLPGTTPLLPIPIEVIANGPISSYPAAVTITVTAAPSGCTQIDGLSLAMLGLVAVFGSRARKHARAARV